MLEFGKYKINLQNTVFKSTGFENQVVFEAQEHHHNRQVFIEALQLLEKCPEGRAVLDFLHKSQIPITFNNGLCKENNAAGLYCGMVQGIVLSNGNKGSSFEPHKGYLFTAGYIASTLMHEIGHNLQDRNGFSNDFAHTPRSFMTASHAREADSRVYEIILAFSAAGLLEPSNPYYRRKDAAALTTGQNYPIILDPHLEKDDTLLKVVETNLPEMTAAARNNLGLLQTGQVDAFRAKVFAAYYANTGTRVYYENRALIKAEQQVVEVGEKAPSRGLFMHHIWNDATVKKKLPYLAGSSINLDKPRYAAIHKRHAQRWQRLLSKCTWLNAAQKSAFLFPTYGKHYRYAPLRRMAWVASHLFTRRLTLKALRHIHKSLKQRQVKRMKKVLPKSLEALFTSQGSLPDERNVFVLPDGVVSVAGAQADSPEAIKTLAERFNREYQAMHHYEDRPNLRFSLILEDRGNNLRGFNGGNNQTRCYQIDYLILGGLRAPAMSFPNFYLQNMLRKINQPPDIIKHHDILTPAELKIIHYWQTMEAAGLNPLWGEHVPDEALPNDRNWNYKGMKSERDSAPHHIRNAKEVLDNVMYLPGERRSGAVPIIIDVPQLPMASITAQKPMAHTYPS